MDPSGLVLMYDAVTAGNVPSTAELVAGYVDGRYAWSPADWARFSCPHVTITVEGRPKAMVCDCETYDLTPAQAAEWARAETDSGRHPVIYCSASRWAEVRALAPTLTGWWIADYDDVAVVPAGAIAKQYRDAGPYDLSVVVPGVWTPRISVAPAGGPPAVSVVPPVWPTGPRKVWEGVTRMYLVIEEGTGYWLVRSTGAPVPVPTSADVAVWQELLGGPAVTPTITVAQLQALQAANP
jgi:hypothetical protein